MKLSKKEFYQIVLESIQELILEIKNNEEDKVIKKHLSKEKDPKTGEPMVHGKPKTFKSHGSHEDRRLLYGSKNKQNK